VVNDNEPLRIPIRKRPQEHCVDYTENRAVRSNSEREREQDDQREARGFAKTSKGVPDVLEPGIHRESGIGNRESTTPAAVKVGQAHLSERSDPGPRFLAASIR